MALIVQKFGGSSVASPAQIRRVAGIIADRARSGDQLVVVVSAMGKMTDQLVALAHQTVERPYQREMDMLLTAGERVTMSLLAMVLHQEGIPAISFTGSQSGIITDNNHTEARILEIKAARIREALDIGKVAIVAGFQGVSREKEVTTLGRGGSDTTAVALAAALGAQLCEIYTDVPGLFSADPRLVEDARLLSSCSYEEAIELATLGAKMHPRSLELAKRFGVRVCIRSTFDIKLAGTEVSNLVERKKMEQSKIIGVATKKRLHHFRMRTEVSDLCLSLKDSPSCLRFFGYADGAFNLLCDSDKVGEIRTWIKGEAEENADVSIVSLVGEGLAHAPRVAAQVLEAVHALGAECFWLSHSTLSIMVAVPSSFEKELANKLHELFIQHDGESARSFPPQSADASVDLNTLVGH